MRIALGVLLVATMVTGVRAEPTTAPNASVPGVSWHSIDPAGAGWSTERLAAAKTFADRLGVTAHMVVWKGEVVASWGDVRRKVDVASVRKSLLSALYGIAVADGKIHLDSTLAQLDIDDKPPSLTSAEKKATVRDLLMARSGVYHQAAHETAAIKRNRPERGSHAPGSFWFYNNWDFNVLGAIYRQATGEDIFWSFAKHIASPIGMEDFNAGDGRYVFDPSSSYPAYPFRLSARDAARFGCSTSMAGDGGTGRSCRKPGCGNRPPPIPGPIAGGRAMAICGGRCRPMCGAKVPPMRPAMAARSSPSCRRSNSSWCRRWTAMRMRSACVRRCSLNCCG